MIPSGFSQKALRRAYQKGQQMAVHSVGLRTLQAALLMEL
jgi:hypothetical protein